MTLYRRKNYRQVNALLRKNVKTAVQRSTIIVKQQVQLQLNRGNSQRGANPSVPGTPPHKFTGRLSRIETDFTRINEANPRGRAGTHVPYARIHEYGGTIEAKGKLLTVPLNQEARNMRLRNPTLKGIPGLFVMNPRKKGGGKFTTTGSTILAMRIGKGKGAKIKPMFVLKSRVHMPARPFMRPAAKKARPLVREEFAARRLLAGAEVIR